MSTNSTIRIKLGAIEVECTATEDSLKAELPVLMQSMVDMHRAQFPAGNSATATQEPGNMEPTISENNHGTTRSIAAALSVKSGPELVLAACLRLAKQGKREYGRKDIHAAMKEATGYYKTSFQANLSQSLTNLVKQGDLLEVKKEIYALSVQKQKDLEGRLVSAPKT